MAVSFIPAGSTLAAQNLEPSSDSLSMLDTIQMRVKILSAAASTAGYSVDDKILVNTVPPPTSTLIDINGEEYRIIQLSQIVGAFIAA